MVTRHRVNLSFTPLEYQMLSKIATAYGKTPSTLASEMVRVLMRDLVQTPQTAQEGEKDPRQIDLLSDQKKRPKTAKNGSRGGA